MTVDTVGIHINDEIILNMFSSHISVALVLNYIEVVQIYCALMCLFSYFEHFTYFFTYLLNGRLSLY